MTPLQQLKYKRLQKQHSKEANWMCIANDGTIYAIYSVKPPVIKVANDGLHSFWYMTSYNVVGSIDVGKAFIGWQDTLVQL
jgi:hypothetical protein